MQVINGKWSNADSSYFLEICTNILYIFCVKSGLEVTSLMLPFNCIYDNRGEFMLNGVECVIINASLSL